MQTTTELLEELLKKPKGEIEFALTTLMATDKIDFINVQQSYVRYLELLKKKNLDHIIESEVCILESLMYDKIPANDKNVEMSVQRRLYYLNQGNRINMKKLNEKFKYDYGRAKTYNHEND